ncbi:MAG TPA: hypothetical protein VHI14_05350 [Jatrophihabitantaceae bacterium]|nr:hypothetical protein [Jatrophihabitantaceae bacterium]
MLPPAVVLVGAVVTVVDRVDVLVVVLDELDVVGLVVGVVVAGVVLAEESSPRATAA